MQFPQPCWPARASRIFLARAFCWCDFCLKTAPAKIKMPPAKFQISDAPAKSLNLMILTCHVKKGKNWKTSFGLGLHTVKPSGKRSFLTLTQFFDAKTHFSGRMDGTIRFALLFRVGIEFSFLIWNNILSRPHEMKQRTSSSLGKKRVASSDMS